MASVEVPGASAALAEPRLSAASVAQVEVTTAGLAEPRLAAVGSGGGGFGGAAHSAEAAGTGKGRPPRGRRGKVLREGQRGRPFPDQNFI